LAERAGPGSFMLAPGGPGCKSAGPCHLYIRPKHAFVIFLLFPCLFGKEFCSCQLTMPLLAIQAHQDIL